MSLTLKMFRVIMVLLLVCLNLIAQNKAITGVVKDANKEAIVGASIIVKGTKQGTFTDLDGRFTLQTSPNAVLVVSCIGFTSQDVNLDGKDNYEIVLSADNLFLDEVVVIGYGTARKRDLTGAVSTLRPSALEHEAPRSVQDVLRGNIAGLSIGMSTNPSGTASLQLRGKNSLATNSEPLYVVDGVIYEGGLSDINPMDIEQVDVLKDASSSAIYGAKAANGVIVIVTKKGAKGGKPTINFNSNIGVASVANKPKLLDGPGFIKFRQDYEMGKKTDEYLATYPEIYTDPRSLSGVNQIDWYNYDQANPVSSATEEQLLRSWLARLELKSPEIENYLNNNLTRWDDIVFQTAFQQDYTVSISNSTDQSSYYWSLGYADRGGVVTNEEYNVFRTRLNLESKITKYLSVGVNVNFSSKDESKLRDMDNHVGTKWDAMVLISPYGSNNIGDVDSRYQRLPTGDGTGVNPLYDAMFVDRKKLYQTLNGVLYADIKLPFNIGYRMNFAPHLRWHEEYRHKSSKNENWIDKGGEVMRTHQKNWHWQIDNIFSWKKKFGESHNVETTFLINAEKAQSWKTVANGRNFSPSDILGYHNIKAGTYSTNDSDDNYRTGDALMGRLFYSYQHKYMLTTSVRRDGYSAFGQKNPRALFSSVALGWVFTSEKFGEKLAPTLNYGKLRISWGSNGNREIGQYEALSNLTSGLHPYIDENGNIDTSSYLYADRMQNKDLKWERTNAFNFGLDFALFNSRLSGSIETYISETNDLLVKRELPEIGGFNYVMSNLGKLENKGFELTLNADIIKNQNFTWNTSANFSLNRRKIKKLYGDMIDVLDDNGNVIGKKEADDLKNKWFIGKDPDQYWDYVRDGVWQLGEEEEAAKYGCAPGDFKYLDMDGDGLLTDKDYRHQKYSTPRFRWTFRNEFSLFKNITASFMLYSYWGHYGTFNRASNNNSFPDRSSDYEQPRWTKDNPINDYARMGSKNLGNNYVNKSFIRLENITLGYNLPKKMLENISIQNLRLSFSIRNVTYFSPEWKFWDPEESGPLPRTFNLNVNFTL